MTQARSSYVRLFYEGKNITRSISPFLINFTFTDNSGGKADDISLTLEDKDGLWASAWFPEKGDKIQASIIHIDESRAKALPCGLYEIDSIDYSAPPRTITIKGISTAISKNMRHERHNKNWENITLQAIAAELAGKNNLTLYYSGENPFFERQIQSGISDLAFLQNLCSDFGLNLKIHDNKMIIYDVDANSDRDSVAIIEITDKHLISWKFSTKSAKVYKSAKVSYHDPVKNETYHEEYYDTNVEGSEEILEINERVESQSEAKKIAEKRLKQANKNEVKGNITIIGGVDFLAGNNVTLKGFGAFDGKYMIEKVTHSLGSGFTSQLELTMGGSSKSAAKDKKKARKKKASLRKNKKNSGRTPEFNYAGAVYYGD